MKAEGRRKARNKENAQKSVISTFHALSRYSRRRPTGVGTITGEAAFDATALTAQSSRCRQSSSTAPRHLINGRALNPFVGCNEIAAITGRACRLHPVSEPWIAGLHCAIEQVPVRAQDGWAIPPVRSAEFRHGELKILPFGIGHCHSPGLISKS